MKMLYNALKTQASMFICAQNMCKLTKFVNFIKGPFLMTAVISELVIRNCETVEHLIKDLSPSI